MVFPHNRGRPTTLGLNSIGHFWTVRTLSICYVWGYLGGRTVCLILSPLVLSCHVFSCRVLYSSLCLLPTSLVLSSASWLSIFLASKFVRLSESVRIFFRLMWKNLFEFKTSQCNTIQDTTGYKQRQRSHQLTFSSSSSSENFIEKQSVFV